MLMPKRVKHRKVMRGRMSGVAKGGTTIAFGEYGLMTEEPAWITSRQIEAARRAMTRHVQAWRQDLDPHLPRQAGHQEAGRGAHGLGQGCPGPLGRRRQARPHPLRDVGRAARAEAAEAMRLASHKLPVDVKFVVKEGVADGHR